MLTRILKACCLLPAMTLLVAGPGCFPPHITTMDVDPDGVRVSVDNVELGTTPSVTMESSYWSLPRTYLITLERPGYKKATKYVHAQYHPDASLFWLFAFIFPYFFTARPEPHYEWKLEPKVDEGLKPDVGPTKGSSTLKEEDTKRVIKEEPVVD